MRQFFNRAIAALLLCNVGATAPGMAGQAKKAAVKNPVSPTPESIATGQALFQKYCRFCHGADAKGNGPQAPKDSHPPNLTDDTWDHGSTDADIFATIKDGVGPKFDMKGFNSRLTSEEMWSVVNYIRSIGPKDAPR